MTARHSPEAVAALIGSPWITPHQRNVLIGAAATLRRGRNLSEAQEAVVGRVMRAAMKDDRDGE